MKKLSLLIAGLVASFGLSAATFNVTVPEGTNECYVVGAPGWDANFVKMEGSGTSFSVTTDLIDGSAFKYCSGPNWKYVEKQADGQTDVDNRTAPGTPDVVAAWAAVYDPGVAPDFKNITVKVKADQAPTIWWWDGGTKCPNAEAAGETWPGPTMAADAANAGWFAKTFADVDGSIHLKIGGDAAFFDQVVSADICIDATGANIDCPGGVTPPTPPTPTPTPGAGDGKYFVWGNGADDANGSWCSGADWGAGTVSMTNNTITYSNVAPGTYQFKVTNGAWNGSTTPAGEAGQEWDFSALNAASTEGAESNGGNIKFSVSAPADITVSFIEGDEKPVKLESTVPFGPMVISVYTVVGTANIMGSATDFDVNDTNNDMVAAGDGSYTLVKKGVVLEETNPMAEAADLPYKYKVVGNHSYAAYEFPGAGMDQKIQVFAGSGEVEAAGTYDLTFTFNPNLPDEEPTKLSVAATTSTGVEEIAAEANVTVSNGYISADEAFEIYNLVGQNVSAQNGNLFGIYIVKFADSAVKVQVR